MAVARDAAAAAQALTVAEGGYSVLTRVVPPPATSLGLPALVHALSQQLHLLHQRGSKGAPPAPPRALGRVPQGTAATAAQLERALDAMGALPPVPITTLITPATTLTTPNASGTTAKDPAAAAASSSNATMITATTSASATGGPSSSSSGSSGSPPWAFSPLAERHALIVADALQRLADHCAATGFPARAAALYHAALVAWEVWERATCDDFQVRVHGVWGAASHYVLNVTSCFCVLWHGVCVWERGRLMGG